MMQAGDVPMSTALPVWARRVVVPQAGRVDPLEWLPPDSAKVVANLETLRREPHEWEDIHMAWHRVPESEWRSWLRSFCRRAWLFWSRTRTFRGTGRAS